MAKSIDIPDVVSNVKVAINAQGKSSKATSTYTIKKLGQNIIGKYNTLTQDMLSESNCKYIIKYDYTLANNTIVVPENCILEFDGGSISNGTLVGNNTIVSTILEEDKVLININKQGTIIVQPWDFNVKPDEEDVTNANGLIKFKDKEAGNGMGKVILRNNFVEQYPSNTWMFTKVKGIVYLLYSYKGKVYAIYNADEYRGLVLKNNVVKETLSYHPENLPEIVEENYLAYTTESNVHTITLPDGSTITSTVLDATEMFMLDETEKVKVNLLTQSMIDKKNTIYIIKYDFDLEGKEITIPEGCILDFDGGSMSNGSIVWDNTKLTNIYSNTILINITESGTKKVFEPIYL